MMGIRIEVIRVREENVFLVEWSRSFFASSWLHAPYLCDGETVQIFYVGGRVGRLGTIHKVQHKYGPPMAIFDFTYTRRSRREHLMADDFEPGDIIEIKPNPLKEADCVFDHVYLHNLIFNYRGPKEWSETLYLPTRKPKATCL